VAEQLVASQEQLSSLQTVLTVARRRQNTTHLLYEQYRSVKRSSFWEVKLCSPLTVNLRFGGSRRLHVQGRKISQARNQQKILCLLTSSCWFFLAYSSTLKMGAKRRFTFNGLHDISQDLFISTTVRTSYRK
jgi:hypothetical protein